MKRRDNKVTPETRETFNILTNSLQRAFARKVRAQTSAGRESSWRRALRARRTWAEVVRTVELARGEGGVCGAAW